MFFFRINAKNIFDYFKGCEFDSICIDLYTINGYPEFLFEINYLTKIKSLLTNKGILILNAFGLPDHLRPLQGNNPQVYIMNALYEVFNNVSYIINRRNMTLVSALGNNPLCCLGESKVDLNVNDLLAYKMINLRWQLRMRMSTPLDINNNLKPDILTKEFLNKEMSFRWRHLIEVLSQYLIVENDMFTKQNLKEYILYRPEVFLDITLDLLKDNKPEASFLPITIGSLSFTLKHDFSWFIKWFIANSNFILKYQPEWGVNIALTQIVSIIINDSGNYNNFITDIDKIIMKTSTEL